MYVSSCFMWETDELSAESDLGDVTVTDTAEIMRLKLKTLMGRKVLASEMYLLDTQCTDQNMSLFD